MRLLLLFAVAGLLAACATKKEKKPMNYSEQHRPQIHFSPATNWTNDPNGLVYHDGEYHLFFQYNPYGDTWGHMSWGHAVSKDLLHWQQLPVALTEYQDGTTGDSTMIFSGTVVIDQKNTAGFGSNAMVAIYTSHVHKNNQTVVQHQSMAYSLDKGRTWKRYDKNPILNIERKDFRDPKVFWYDPQQKWIMALVVPDLYKVQFYSSSNLKDWKVMSEFGNAGDRARIWECPDLFELPIVNGGGATKWVLSLSGSHPQGKDFVGMQYFVGDFDGTTFTAQDTSSRYVDFGKDYYAGIIFNNLDKKIMLGWVNNWTYANQVPTSPWRGAFSIPRELSLQRVEDKYVLSQQPIYLASIRKDRIEKLGNTAEPLEFYLDLQDVQAGFQISGSEGEQLKVGLDSATHQLFIDRTKAGKVDFQKQFVSIEKTPPLQLPVRLHVIIDQSIVEIFANEGEATMCEQFFFTSTQSFSLSTFGDAKLREGYTLKSIWRDH